MIRFLGRRRRLGWSRGELSLYLRDGIVTQEEQHDLDKLGIAKNAGELPLAGFNVTETNNMTSDMTASEAAMSPELN